MSKKSPEGLLIMTSIIFAGFIVITALVFRQGSIQVTPVPGLSVPGITIDSSPNKECCDCPAANRVKTCAIR